MHHIIYIYIMYNYYVNVIKIIYHIQDNIIITTSIPIAIPVNSEVENYTTFVL